MANKAIEARTKSSYYRNLYKSFALWLISFTIIQSTRSLRLLPWIWRIIEGDCLIHRERSSCCIVLRILRYFLRLFHSCLSFDSCDTISTAICSSSRTRLTSREENPSYDYLFYYWNTKAAIHRMFFIFEVCHQRLISISVMRFVLIEI